MSDSLQKELSDQTNALKRDWALLDRLRVDAAQVDARSAVFQREFIEDGKTIPVYVKVYTYRKHPLQRYGRKGRSQIETRNLLFFRRLDIPAARVVAWGEKRNAIGRIVEEYIVTEAIEDAIPIDGFIAQHCPDRSKPEFCERRDFIIDNLGKWTQRIHKHRFFHQDLKWRNVLARLRGNQVQVFWIDCPIGGFQSLPFRTQKRCLKDCATLDKLARIHCSTEERTRFIAAYLGKAPDSREVARMGKAISNYRRRRFDAEDERQKAQHERSINEKKFRALTADAEILEKDGFGIKVYRLKDDTILKLFRRKRLLSSQLWAPHAWRFQRNAKLLRQRGIPTVQVESVFDVPHLDRSAVRYQALPGETLRHSLEHSDPAEAERLMQAFARLVAQLHDKGVLFRSLHLGNVLVLDNGTLALIDIVDMGFRWFGPLFPSQRVRNFRHIARYPKDQALLAKGGTDCFIQHYFEAATPSPRTRSKLTDANPAAPEAARPE